MPRLVCRPSVRKISVLAAVVACLLSTALISVDLDVGALLRGRLSTAALFDLLHIPLFMLIAVLWLQIIEVYKLTGRQRAASAFLFTLSVGILYELAQTLVPGRNPSLGDVAINSAASAAGIAAYLRIERSHEGFLRRIVCEDRGQPLNREGAEGSGTSRFKG